jgi:hypothetical protein
MVRTLDAHVIEVRTRALARIGVRSDVCVRVAATFGASVVPPTDATAPVCWSVFGVGATSWLTLTVTI